ncbi:MAG: hypothetical protein AN485_21475 [Anabaena sp. MDT14b]|nr:MAG: hypothetical protein AN485_21475 [Anabaena sp. MDT14b]
MRLSDVCVGDGDVLFCDNARDFLSSVLRGGGDDGWTPYASKVEATALVASQVSLPAQAATASLIDLLPSSERARWSSQDGVLLDPASVSPTTKAICFASRSEYLLLVERMMVAPCASLVVTSDASSSGMGVVYAAVDRTVVESLLLVSPSSARSLDKRVPALPLVGTGSTSQLPAPLANARWRTAVSSRWRNAASHINVLEAVACRTALRWLLSRPRYAGGSRVLFLTDSLVVTGALAKGRSSSYSLLAQLRRVAALVLATGTQMVALWVPTHLNPSDEASRHV